MATGDKEMGVEPSNTPALGEIVFECHAGRGMQWEQTTFLELGVPDA